MRNATLLAVLALTGTRVVEGWASVRSSGAPARLTRLASGADEASLSEPGGERDREVAMRDSLTAMIEATKVMNSIASDAASDEERDLSFLNPELELETELEKLVQSMGDAQGEGELTLSEPLDIGAYGGNAAEEKKKRMDEFKIVQELLKKMDKDDFAAIFKDQDDDKENPIIGDLF